MAVDVLRSAHTTRAQVGRERPYEVPLRWYKCAEGAKELPFFHAFGNPVWEPYPEEWTQGPGVYFPPDQWRPKDIDAPPGQEFHGPVEWWQKGIPAEALDNPEPHERPPCIPERPVGMCGINYGFVVQTQYRAGWNYGMIGAPS